MNQRLHDESVVTDFLRGELTEEQKAEVQERLDRDEPFRRLHDDVSHTFQALGLLPEVEPPQQLVANTLARIHRTRHTDALLAREESRRMAPRATFSMRELGAVAAALILMAAVFIPSLRQARQMARIGQCASNAGQIGSALMTYASANGERLPSADGNHSRWLPADGEEAVSNSSALYKLVDAGYASPLVFQCPAGPQSSFVVQAGMTDFPADKYVGYSYQHSAGRTLRSDDPQLLPVADRMAILADSTPVFPNGHFDRRAVTARASENHGGAGQNVLYLDMHTAWSDTPEAGVAGDNIFLAKDVYQYRGVEVPAAPTDTFLLPAYSALPRR